MNRFNISIRIASVVMAAVFVSGCWHLGGYGAGLQSSAQHKPPVPVEHEGGDGHH